jgi:hypothetical protein
MFSSRNVPILIVVLHVKNTTIFFVNHELLVSGLFGEVLHFISVFHTGTLIPCWVSTWALRDVKAKEMQHRYRYCERQPAFRSWFVERSLAMRPTNNKTKEKDRYAL